MMTVLDLTTPMPSGVGAFGSIPVPGTEPSGTWFSELLSLASSIQLPTTSWQPGAPERTILAIEAVAFAQSDVDVSIMAMGGFLQTAATGSVTSTALNGTQITTYCTPDPSNASQNPTGQLGWLDQNASNVYGVTRLAATYCEGPLAIVNLRGSSVRPFAPGQYHVGQSSGQTYSNGGSLTVPSSVIAGTGGVITSVSPGLTQTVLATQSAHGLAAGDSVYLSIPFTSGISGLQGAFALVTGTTTNTLSISLGSSGTYTGGGTVYLCTVATMVADVLGTGSNAPPGSVNTTITQNAGVFCSNVTSWAGNNWESNVALANRCVLSLANRSPNGPNQSYVYYAETAQQLLSAQSPPYVLTNGAVVANASGNPQTGVVTTVVASSSPVSTVLGDSVTPGCAQLGVVGVSNTNPCVVTCGGATSLLPGQSMAVTISGALGVSGVNGTNLATYVAANSFSVPVDTTTGGAYAGGGSVEGGDLGQIDALIQRNVVPNNTTALTVSALALPVTVTATVAVPQAYVASYKLAAKAQVQTQIASYPLGGAGSSSPQYSVPWDDILGALSEAGVVIPGGVSYASIQSLTISGNAQTVSSSGGGISFPSSRYQALLASVAVTVLGT